LSSPSTPASPRTVLHVGCGIPHPDKLHNRFRGPEWREIRLDIDPECEPDIVADIADLSAIGAASVDAVWSSHNLEHLEAHQVPVALGEFLRVLRPGGLALITTPNLAKVARLVAKGKLEDTIYTSRSGPVTPLDMLYGFGPFLARGHTAMAHRTGFTRRSLGRHLTAAGFVDVRTWVAKRKLDLWAEAARPHPRSVVS
jgi:SAM-dependent methyltransferase